MKKIIVDYKNVDRKILEFLVNEFPYGFDDSVIIKYTNSKGEKVECVEVVIDDTDYLIKLSGSLSMAMDEFEEEITVEEIDPQEEFE